MVLCAAYTKAQSGFYRDLMMKTELIIVEKPITNSMASKYKKTTDEVTKYLLVPASYEYLNRGKIDQNNLDNIGNGIDELSYNELCNGGYIYFFKKEACDRKKKFLINSANILEKLVSLNTENRINNGVKSLIFEKYIATISLIQFELNIMSRENEKRKLFKGIFYD